MFFPLVVIEFGLKHWPGAAVALAHDKVQTKTICDTQKQDALKSALFDHIKYGALMACPEVS